MYYTDLEDVGRYNLPHPKTETLLNTSIDCYNKLINQKSKQSKLVDNTNIEDLKYCINNIINYIKKTGKLPGILSDLYNRLYISLFTSQQSIKYTM